MTTLIEEKEITDKASEYQTALTEIERRKSALAATVAPTPLAMSLPLPENLQETQKFFLMNLANKKQRPKCDEPAFRCLGVFASKEDLQYHVEDFYTPTECDLHCIELGQSFVICETTEQQTSPTYGVEKRDKVLAWHAEYRKEAKVEFDKNVQEKKAGETGKSIRAMRNKAKEEVEGKKKQSTREAAIKHVVKQQLRSGNLQRVKPVPRNAELREQNVLVIDVFVDPSAEAWQKKAPSEPVITFWGVFSNDEEAKKFVAYFGNSMAMKDRNMFGVPMYEFVYPETYLDYDKITEIFRNAEQQRILNKNIGSEAQKDVDLFKQECLANETPVPSENQVYDPEHPRRIVKAFTKEGTELEVTTGLQPEPKRDKFPAVPKDSDIRKLGFRQDRPSQ